MASGDRAFDVTGGPTCAAVVGVIGEVEAFIEEVVAVVVFTVAELVCALVDVGVLFVAVFSCASVSCPIPVVVGVIAVGAEP